LADGKPAEFSNIAVENFPSLAGFNSSTKLFMKRSLFTVVSGIALSSFSLSSCDTPTGAGAGYGAAAGAIIGGAATGHVRGAAIGAAAGAATGALIGHSIQEDRARAYGPVPPGGWPLARYTNTPGVFRSPYTGRRYDLSDVPPGGLTRDIDTGQLFRRPYRGYY
jgi:predicted small secreted protein